MGLHHISIPASNPSQVAKVLAEILGTHSVSPFPGRGDCFVALALDSAGTFVEVYPESLRLFPGLEANDPVQMISGIKDRTNYTFHANLSVPICEEEILAIAKREGWRACRCNRDGVFNVVEFWVENVLLLELMPPEFAAQYVAFMHPAKLATASAPPRNTQNQTPKLPALTLVGVVFSAGCSSLMLASKSIRVACKNAMLASKSKKPDCKQSRKWSRSARANSKQKNAPPYLQNV
jgi:hypothetical protein